MLVAITPLCQVYSRQAARSNNIEFYADVIPTLDTLRGSYALSLLSNGNGYSERCGLPDRFQFGTFSQDVGVEKPDPMIFLKSYNQTGCDPSKLMHIGDSLTGDVTGANGVSAFSVWLNREDRQNSSGIGPDTRSERSQNLCL